ncbi:MAG: DNA-binding protein [Muribaculaceae bacterium]|nr:DNA-binding protein [Muribaculaceae bacterium]
MKLKYFIPAFVALIGAILVSCSDEDTMTLLNEIQVSRSYVPINIDGGEATIDITTTDSWSFEEADIPDWLTITPLSGGAGQTKITFSAPAAPDGRNADLEINCAGRTQHIKVIQGLLTIQDATCAEIISSPDGKTFRVTGAVTRYASNYQTYGNCYISDGTGEIQLYGMADKNGKLANNPLASWNIEIGDIITVEGPKSTYKGEAELVDVTVIKVVKSLLKVETTDPEDATIDKDGGECTIYFTSKGNGLTVEIPDEDKSWLSISSVTGGSSPAVTFHAAPNTGGARSSVVTFKTSNGSQESAITATIYQTGSIVDVTCAEFLAQEEGDTEYRITAVIQKVSNTNYGNIYLRDYTNQEVYVYGVGSPGDFTALGLKEGDIVTLVGKRSSYNGNPQMKGAQYVSHYSVTDISIADFMNMPDDPNSDAPSQYYRLTGVIEDIGNGANDPVYGNLYLSDDGGATTLYIYGCYPGWGALGNDRKGWLQAANIEVGDELTIIGYKKTYNGKIELCGGIYFSHVKGG